MPFGTTRFGVGSWIEEVRGVEGFLGAPCTDSALFAPQVMCDPEKPSPIVVHLSAVPQVAEEPEEGFNPVVVAEGTEALKSLSVASAVAELDLTGAPVVVFEHAGSGRVNVVYRRRDGAIGWLDPH